MFMIGLGQTHNLTFIFPNIEEGKTTNRKEIFQEVNNANCFVEVINDDYIFDLSYFLKNANKCFFYKGNTNLFKYIKMNQDNERLLLFVSHSYYISYKKNIYKNEYRYEFKHIANLKNMWEYDVFEIKRID